MLTRFLALVLLSSASGQLISMNVCSDTKCSVDCVSWTASASQCVPCDTKKGLCSLSNPSSITTAGAITLYSDSQCTVAIPGTNQMSITLDNTCRELVASGTRIGSYKASNLSVTIGVTIGVILLVSIGCGCCCYAKGMCCCKRQVQQQPQQDPQIQVYSQGPAVPYLSQPYGNAPTYALPAQAYSTPPPYDYNNQHYGGQQPTASAPSYQPTAPYLSAPAYYPQAAYPQTQAAYPQTQAAYPQTQAAYPQTQYPSTAYPPTPQQWGRYEDPVAPYQPKVI
jgi:hypothetical protein